MDRSTSPSFLAPTTFRVLKFFTPAERAIEREHEEITRSIAHLHQFIVEAGYGNGRFHKLTIANRDLLELAVRLRRLMGDLDEPLDQRFASELHTTRARINLLRRELRTALARRCHGCDDRRSHREGRRVAPELLLVNENPL